MIKRYDVWSAFENFAERDVKYFLFKVFGRRLVQPVVEQDSEMLPLTRLDIQPQHGSFNAVYQLGPFRLSLDMKISVQQ